MSTSIKGATLERIIEILKKEFPRATKKELMELLSRIIAIKI